ncbi:hypothetical protein [Cupriavidus necator]|uniref:hypothetical protein n=1 Tax=Cupriavidus necator TaxID=106590 RepID=UPI00339D5DB7
MQFRERVMTNGADAAPLLGAAHSPLVTRERFAELVGLPLGVIESQCDKGYWPTYRVGKYSLINLALLQSQLLGREFTHPERS